VGRPYPYGATIDTRLIVLRCATRSTTHGAHRTLLGVKKRRDHTSFAEILREVKENPPSQGTPMIRALYISSGTIHDPSGRIWQRLDEQITAGRAFDLASKGALVAWDSCGCGGYCGLTWLDADDVVRLVKSGRPVLVKSKRPARRGNLSEWTAEDGQLLVLAELYVRWGDLLA
jgi:hypothetical protein